jgi:type IV secretion system protein VirD4
MTILVGGAVLYGRKKPKNTGSFGSSRWMKNNEIKKLGFLQKSGVVIGQTNDAVWANTESQDQGKWKQVKEGDILTSSDNSHCAIIAPTRRGKGINTVLPSMISWSESVVVYDIKKEIFNATSVWRSKFSHVLRFEPAHPESVCYNPLLDIDFDLEGSRAIGQIQALVDIISDPNGEGGYDHWRNTAKFFLQGVILHLLYVGQDKSLYGVYEFINNPSMKIQETLKTMLDTKHIVGQTDVNGQVMEPRTHHIVSQVARNMLNKAPNELSGVVSTASTYLELFSDPHVARATSTSDFRVMDLMNQEHPVSLYIVVSPKDADRLRPLTRLMFQVLGTKLTAEHEVKHRHKLLMMIDEFPTLGTMEFLETQIAFFAGFGIKMCIVSQSFSQILQKYGEHTAILDNCKHKAILGVDTPKDAELVTKYLGTETIMRKSATTSGGMHEAINSSKSVQISEAGKSLMTTDEVQRLPYENVILLLGGNYPYLAKKIFWFKNKYFRSCMSKDPAFRTYEEQKREFFPFEQSPWLAMEEVRRKYQSQLEPEQPATADSNYAASGSRVGGGYGAAKTSSGGGFSGPNQFGSPSESAAFKPSVRPGAPQSSASSKEAPTSLIQKYFKKEYSQKKAEEAS